VCFIWDGRPSWSTRTHAIVLVLESLAPNQARLKHLWPSRGSGGGGGEAESPGLRPKRSRTAKREIRSSPTAKASVRASVCHGNVDMNLRADLLQLLLLLLLLSQGAVCSPDSGRQAGALRHLVSRYCAYLHLPEFVRSSTQRLSKSGSLALPPAMEIDRPGLRYRGSRRHGGRGVVSQADRERSPCLASSCGGLCRQRVRSSASLLACLLARGRRNGEEREEIDCCQNGKMGAPIVNSIWGARGRARRRTKAIAETDVARMKE